MMLISPQVTWGPFLNRMSGRICGCGCSCSQSRTWCDHLPRHSPLFKSDRNYHGTVPVCATAVILEILHICTWASVNCCQNIDLSMLLFTLCIHTCKGTYLPETLFTFVFVVQCGILWDVCWHVLYFDHPLQPQPLIMIVCKQEHDDNTSKQPVVSNIFCFKWPVEHAPEVRPVHRGAFGITV